MTIEELKLNISIAERDLSEAKFALSRFEELAENNVYDCLKEAGYCIQMTLLSKAREHCEGADNCGNNIYEQKFIVSGEIYVAILEVDYDRHDKTYYYVDNTRFSITKNNTEE